MSEENFDDIDERQTYVQASHRLVLDLHIRLPESPPSLQLAPLPVSDFAARLPDQGSNRRPAVGSASPRRTVKPGRTIRKGKEENRPKPLSSLSPSALQRTATHQPFTHSTKPVKDTPGAKLPKSQPKQARSNELLAEALTREVDCAWTRLGLRQYSSQVDLGCVLTEMRFLEGTEKGLVAEIWKALSGEELGYVNKQSLLNFLFTLHTLKCPARSVDTEASETDPAVINFEDPGALRTRFKYLLVNKKKAHFKPKPAKAAFSSRPAGSPSSRKRPEKQGNTQATSPVRLKPKYSELDISKTGRTLRPRSPKADLRATEDYPEMLRVWPTAGQSLVEPREPEEPVMLLNVTLPTDETVQLPLYRGDQVELRVREFAEMRRLEKSAESRIVEAVLQQWSAL